MSKESTTKKPKSKRSNYTSQACDSCRKKHVRCDGNKPCFQCNKRGDDCTYTFKKVKRGPKPNGARKQKKRVDCVSETMSSASESQSSFSINSEAKYEMDYSMGSVGQPVAVRSAPFGSDLMSLTSDHIVDALFGFQYRVSSFYPNSFVLDAAFAVDFAGALISNNYVPHMSNDQKLTYSVVLAHGLRMTGQDKAAVIFGKYADLFYRELFLSDAGSYSGYENNEDRVISAMCLLIDFKMQQGELKLARRYALETYSILDVNLEKIHPMLAHRVYSYMAGVSRNPSDVAHWVDNACMLGTDASTPINRVFLSFHHTSTGLLRENKNAIFSESLVFPENRNMVDANSILNFQKMITELCSSEEFVNQYAMNHLSDHLVEEYANCCKVVIYGCRSLVFAQSGSHEKAYLCATKTFQHASVLKGDIVFLLMPLSIAYSLKVLLALKAIPLFEEGMRYLEVYSNCYPIVGDVIHQLNTMLLSNDFSRI